MKCPPLLPAIGFTCTPPRSRVASLRRYRVRKPVRNLGAPETPKPCFPVPPDLPPPKGALRAPRTTRIPRRLPSPRKPAHGPAGTPAPHRPSSCGTGHAGPAGTRQTSRSAASPRVPRRARFLGGCRVMAAQRKYPDELRERAVKMVFDIREQDGKGHGRHPEQAARVAAARHAADIQLRYATLLARLGRTRHPGRRRRWYFILEGIGERFRGSALCRISQAVSAETLSCRRTGSAAAGTARDRRRGSAWLPCLPRSHGLDLADHPCREGSSHLLGPCWPSLRRSQITSMGPAWATANARRARPGPGLWPCPPLQAVP
jgi:hypothetical protein